MTDRPLDPNDLVSPDVLAHLRAHGAHIAYDLALPATAVAGRQPTSRKAAESTEVPEACKGVLDLIAANGSHGLTDAELNAQYAGFAAANGYPRLDRDTPRKRRMQLTDSRRVVDSGRRRPSPSSKRQCIVWVASGTEVSRLAEAS